MIESLPHFKSFCEEGPVKPYWPRWRVYGIIGAIVGSLSTVALMWFAWTGNDGADDITSPFGFAFVSLVEPVVDLCIAAIVGALGYAAGALIGWFRPGIQGR